MGLSTLTNPAEIIDTGMYKAHLLSDSWSYQVEINHPIALPKAFANLLEEFYQLTEIIKCYSRKTASMIVNTWSRPIVNSELELLFTSIFIDPSKQHPTSKGNLFCHSRLQISYLRKYNHTSYFTRMFWASACCTLISVYVPHFFFLQFSPPGFIIFCKCYLFMSLTSL